VVGYRGHSLISNIHEKIICLGGVHAVTCPYAVYRTALRALQEEAAARQYGHTIIYIENGATVNYVDINGWTPLLDASYRGDLKAVSFLVENGADVDCKSATNGHTRGTPLHHAAGLGHTEIVHFLVNNRAKF
jgi:ankyrin repeat protein